MTTEARTYEEDEPTITCCWCEEPATVALIQPGENDDDHTARENADPACDVHADQYAETYGGELDL